MNAEGLNTSHKEEGDANGAAKFLEESESKYVDEEDEKTTGNPSEDTKVEPKTEEELLFCKFCEFQAKNLTVNDVFNLTNICYTLYLLTVYYKLLYKLQYKVSINTVYLSLI